MIDWMELIFFSLNKTRASLYSTLAPKTDEKVIDERTTYHFNNLIVLEGKKILEQLSRPRFFPGYEISVHNRWKKAGKLLNPEKTVVFKVF